MSLPTFVHFDTMPLPIKEKEMIAKLESMGIKNESHRYSSPPPPPTRPIPRFSIETARPEHPFGRTKFFGQLGALARRKSQMGKLSCPCGCIIGLCLAPDYLSGLYNDFHNCFFLFRLLRGRMVY